MKRIEQFGEISSLIGPYMKKGILSNNFIVREGYEAYISSGNLYSQCSDTALILLLDCGTHWRIFYHIKGPEADIHALPADKPLVMELVYKNENEAVESQLDFWSSRGFRPYIYRLRMNGITERLLLESESKNMHAVKNAVCQQAEQIRGLIAEMFDPYLGCIPTLDEVAEYIKKEEMLVSEDQDGSILGVLHIGSRNSAHFVRHLLVHPDARGKGIAKGLLAHFARSVSGQGDGRIQLWVKKDNINARGLYEWAGFKYDGWQSTGLIRNS